jgi:hypothetical protein
VIAKPPARLDHADEIRTESGWRPMTPSNPPSQAQRDRERLIWLYREVTSRDG